MPPSSPNITVSDKPNLDPFSNLLIFIAFLISENLVGSLNYVNKFLMIFLVIEKN